MENASDALIMAGQILIFIVALTVCLSSFTNVRAEVNRIVGENEEIRFAKDGETYVNFIESKKGSANRVVESDTIVTSLYRAIKENYVVYIKFTDPTNDIKNNKYISKITATQTNSVTQINEGDLLIKVTIGTDTNQDVDKVLKDGNDGGRLFEELRKYKFKEYLGEYQDSSDVTSENKQTYRIITYVQI